MVLFLCCWFYFITCQKVQRRQEILSLQSLLSFLWTQLKIQNFSFLTHYSKRNTIYKVIEFRIIDKNEKTDAKRQQASPLWGWWSNWLCRSHIILDHSSEDNDLLDVFETQESMSEQCHSKEKLKCGLLVQLVILQE